MVARTLLRALRGQSLQQFKCSWKYGFILLMPYFNPFFPMIRFSCQVIHKPKSIFSITSGCQKKRCNAIQSDVNSVLPKSGEKKKFFSICKFGLPQKIWQQTEEILHKYSIPWLVNIWKKANPNHKMDSNNNTSYRLPNEELSLVVNFPLCVFFSFFMLQSDFVFVLFLSVIHINQLIWCYAIRFCWHHIATKRWWFYNELNRGCAIESIYSKANRTTTTKIL